MSGGGSMPRRLTVLLGLFGAGLIAACAPRLQPPGVAPGPPQLSDNKFKTKDGVDLPVRIWLPEGEPKAVLLALHGFNDYANAFLEPANFWRRFGIATYAYDQRGFGNTPNRGLWPGTGALAGDAADFAHELRRRYPDTPLFILGDSMGAAVAVVTMANDKTVPVDGLVLVAPAVWARDTMNPLQSGLLWLAAHSVPWMTVSGRGLDIHPSDNVGMLHALSRDPMVLKDSRIDTVYGLTDLMDAAMEDAAGLRAPVLVLYGEQDQVIPRDPVIEFLRRLLPADKKARAAFYPKGFHMLMRDLSSEVVLKDIASFVFDPGAPLPSDAEGRAQQALAVP